MISVYTFNVRKALVVFRHLQVQFGTGFQESGWVILELVQRVNEVLGQVELCNLYVLRTWEFTQQGQRGVGKGTFLNRTVEKWL